MFMEVATTPVALTPLHGAASGTLFAWAKALTFAGVMSTVSLAVVLPP